MKISISKSKDNKGYYTTLKNKYNNEEFKTYMTVQLKKELGDIDYGVYDVDCFLSCYKTQNGEVKPKLVVTEIKGKPAIETKEESDPFKDYSDFGEQIQIDLDDDNLLD